MFKKLIQVSFTFCEPDTVFRAGFVLFMFTLTLAACTFRYMRCTKLGKPGYFSKSTLYMNEWKEIKALLTERMQVSQL